MERLAFMLRKYDHQPPQSWGVQTAIPAFIGYTQKAEVKDTKGIVTGLTLVPTKIGSLNEFVNYFGGPDPENDGLVVNITDTSNSQTITASIGDDKILSPFNLYYSLLLYFHNDGGPCYIISVGGFTIAGSNNTSTSNTPKKGDLEKGLDKLASEDEPTIIVIPEAIKLTYPNDYTSIIQKALKQCATLKDRVLIIDVKTDKGVSNTLSDIEADIKAFRDLTFENRAFGCAYYPYVETSIDYSYLESGIILNHTNNTLTQGKFQGKKLSDLNDDTSDVFNSALYYQIIEKLKGIPMQLPPSPAIAGIYVRIDTERGVWKAPANTGIYDIIRPIVKIDNTSQDKMNVDDTGKSINAIRSFPGRGTLVWGARTLESEHPDWRYINVRRLFNFIEESVQKATHFALFEPNTASTWLKTKAMIESFLYSLWQQGGLAGSMPKQAYFVRVGLGITMNQDDILNGRMVVEIGVAAVRPAEFIILRFMHKLQEA